MRDDVCPRLCTTAAGFFPDGVREQLEAIPGMRVWPGLSRIARDDLRRLLGEVDGILVSPLDRLDAELLAGAPQLRVISSVGTGLDHIDLAVATAKGILVCHTPGLNVEVVMAAAALLLGPDGALAGANLSGCRVIIAGRC